MRKYTLIFCVAYGLICVVGGIVLELLKIKNNAGFGVAAINAASFIAAARFFRDQRREPTKLERKKYSLQAFFSAWLISIALFVLALLINPQNELKTLLNVFQSGITGTIVLLGSGIIVFTSVVYYFSIYWSFGWYAKTALRAEDKKKR
jgi:lysylphosphatidylglycerol synthetase-like protein (DUF2156 family)